MKTRFNTFDIVCGVSELQNILGQRVNQIYDIDNKTYLIRLQGGETKTVLLIESGTRFHTTNFEWPKNVAPSGFSMKLRKHLKNKRLEKVEQLGADRIVDFQFGTEEAAYHVIVELYDRGNVILTDHELTILYILRPHYEGEDVRFAVREKYPSNRAKQLKDLPTEEQIRELLESAASGDSLRRVLMSVLDCGPALVDHILTKFNLANCVIKSKTIDECDGSPSVPADEGAKTKKNKKKQSHAVGTRPFEMEADISNLMQAIQEADNLLAQGRTCTSKGYIIQKKEEKVSLDGAAKEHFFQNVEYHPYFFAQFEGQPVATFDTFMRAVDEFYSALEGQKIDLKTLQQERDAMKKLSNVQKDHAKRLDELTKVQEHDKHKAELITCNQDVVDKAILAIRSAIANQMSWPDIHQLVKSAQAKGDPIACLITQLKLEINHIAIKLSDPYSNSESDGQDNKHEGTVKTVVDVDLALSAWANARRYYDQKRTAAEKEQKTLDASQKALKSAERKTQQTLKDVRAISTISKARKVYWFEKFYWFISSENYLVIGGRDAQQNELIVKRYMRPSDIYVHAEIQGASSVVIRNPTEDDVPPKTLLEAGTMAISYSVAWDAKVVTNAYWVFSNQVSKTAPTGEYLGTGSFMVRGKKNFLPSCHLIMGLSLLFKLEDSFVAKHRGERRVRTFEEEQQGEVESQLKQISVEEEKLDAETEIKLISDDENENEEENNGNNPEALKDLNQEEDSSNECEESEDIANFPDTHVKIEHDTGRITIHTNTTKEENSYQDKLKERNDTLSNIEEAIIISAGPSRKKMQQNSKKRKEEKERKSYNDMKKQHQQSEDENKKSLQSKRGQKGKQKKIKSKYKDQDEEEREMRMQILQSSGRDKIPAGTLKTDEADSDLMTGNPKRSVEPKPPRPTETDEAEDLPAGADVEMIDSLTGQPCDDDELLFAIPVVAPYQALQNYKFKVKLTPGTGKRGRAAKTALLMFSKEKSCGPREKDLLKSIKEEALARNIPGKVKISAPQLQKYKK